jgi:hypothetical protein
MLTVQRRRGREQEVLLGLGNGQVTVTPGKGGTAIRAIPYSRIARASYVKAPEPAWDQAYGPPAPGFAVPRGLLHLRTDRHWLVLQMPGDYLILRLEDDNWERVCTAIEGRTGIHLVRRRAPGRRTP